MLTAMLSATETLLQNYEIMDIILIVFLVLLAGKEIINIIDFFKKRAKNKLKNEDSTEDVKKDVREMKEDIKDLKETTQILLISDKNDIKAWIQEKYELYKERGYVDNYELDCLELRFNDYKKEGGNSYIEDLMTDIRKLDKRPPKKD